MVRAAGTQDVEFLDGNERKPAALMYNIPRMIQNARI